MFIRNSRVYYTGFFFLLFFIYPLTLLGWGELRYAQTTTNIRAERNAKSKIIGKLKPGEKVKVDFLIDNWFAVFEENETLRKESKAIGYVYFSLLRRNPPYSLTQTNWENMWGLGVSKIKKMEDNELIKSEYLNGSEFLIYKGFFDSHECLTSYRFVDNKLIQCSYLITLDSKYSDKCFQEYEKHKKTLTNKYGDPMTSREDWVNYQYRNRPQDWDLAIKVGHLRCKSMWSSKSTVVRIDIFSKDYKPIISVMHFDKKRLSTIKKLTPGWGF